jgi:hypothetical protein
VLLMSIGKGMKVRQNGDEQKEGIEMKKLFLALFFTIILVSPANAQSTLALQEKCAERAKKFFFEHINLYGGKWGGFKDEKGSGYNEFISHYNKKLDRCFIRIEYRYYPKDKNEKVVNSIEIGDAFGGKSYGSFVTAGSLICEVGNKKCNSLDEFEALIKPFMEE